MAAQVEELLAELTKEVRSGTEAYIRLDTTVKTEIASLRKDYSELRELGTALTATLSNHSERITVGETRVFELQHVHRDLADLRADYRALEAQVAANTPTKAPWTAIVSATVALGALLWTLFGK